MISKYLTGVLSKQKHLLKLFRPEAHLNFLFTAQIRVLHRRGSTPYFRLEAQHHKPMERRDGSLLTAATSISV